MWKIGKVGAIVVARMGILIMMLLARCVRGFVVLVLRKNVIVVRGCLIVLGMRRPVNV